MARRFQPSQEQVSRKRSSIFGCPVAVLAVLVLSLLAPSNALADDDDDDGKGRVVDVARVEVRDASKVSTETRTTRVPLSLLSPRAMRPGEIDLSSKPIAHTRTCESFPVVHPDLHGSEFDDSEALAEYWQEDRQISMDEMNDSLAGAYNDGASCGFFHRDLLFSGDPIEHPELRAFKKLLRKVGFRQIRRFFRSDLRDRFEEDPSMSYYEYLERREEVSRIGRGGATSEALRAELLVEESRNEVLENDPDKVEKDIALIDWGPFRLDDRGSLTFGFAENPESSGVTIAPDEDEGPVGKSLFEEKTIKVDTDLKIRPRIERLIDGDTLREVIGDVSMSLELGFLTPIRSREYMTTEFEFSYDTEQQASLFVNFKILGK